MGACLNVKFCAHIICVLNVAIPSSTTRRNRKRDHFHATIVCLTIPTGGIVDKLFVDMKDGKIVLLFFAQSSFGGHGRGK